MNITSARSTTGLQARATPISTNSNSTQQVGFLAESTTYPDADVVYSLQAVIIGSSITLNPFTGVATALMPLTAGTQQVETAIAAGEILTTDVLNVTVTSSNMLGSPLAFIVPVTEGSTEITWAQSVRDTLNANAAFSAALTAGGTGANIVLSVKPYRTFTVPGGMINQWPSNDTALNIAIANGDGTGITPVVTSTNTTAGIATSGCVIFDGDGKDFEGETIPTIGTIYGMQISNEGDPADVVSSWMYAVISNNGKFLRSGDNVLVDSSTVVQSEFSSHVTICVVGKTA